MGVEGVVKFNSDLILNRISALMGIIDFTKIRAFFKAKLGS